MLQIVRLAIIALALVVAGRAPAGYAAVPEWAFTPNPAPHNAPLSLVARSVPGSVASFSPQALKDMFAVHDWFPGDHPAMPPMVARGAPPAMFACGYCHLPNGAGRPENARLAGLPAAYILRQVAEFASGARGTVRADRSPPRLMAQTARAAMASPGLAAVAAYFAAIAPPSTLRVVETATIPRVVLDGFVYRRADGGGTEPVGDRLVELPDDSTLFELRDPRVTYTIYVAPGSLARGETLVRRGDGTRPACTICHGGDLRGLADTPPLAGRSPSYLARQLFDIQAGARHGSRAALMRPVVAHLAGGDIRDIVAYLASLPP